MSEQWQVVSGIGWITIPGFGLINPRRDNVNGGRQYFTATVNGDQYAKATGNSITEGPETWHFSFDDPFFLADSAGACVEVEISLLDGGRYAIKYRPSEWPVSATGGW